MNLKNTPSALSFFSTYLADSDADSDLETAKNFAEKTPSAQLDLLLADVKNLLDSEELPIDEFGSEANRWFGDSEEARAWLEGLYKTLRGGGGSGDVVTKDSNGTPLAEGDSVQVIKDLKVKGGTSDLKRGTLVKKVHLIGDPENIECRVDGSTLVLKTMYLKKV